MVWREKNQYNKEPEGGDANNSTQHLFYFGTEGVLDFFFLRGKEICWKLEML